MPSFSIKIRGTIYAPYADVTGDGEVIGIIFAKSLQGTLDSSLKLTIFDNTRRQL